VGGHGPCQPHLAPLVNVLIFSYRNCGLLYGRDELINDPCTIALLPFCLFTFIAFSLTNALWETEFVQTCGQESPWQQAPIALGMLYLSFFVFCIVYMFFDTIEKMCFKYLFVIFLPKLVFLFLSCSL